MLRLVIGWIAGFLLQVQRLSLFHAVTFVGLFTAVILIWLPNVLIAVLQTMTDMTTMSEFIGFVVEND